MSMGQRCRTWGQVNGTLAAIEFFRKLEGQEVSGTVIVTPTANVQAVNERTKTAAVDRLDMDQCFPGREDGLPTERLAARLFGAMAPGADVVVNLHTLGTPFDSKPYAVYKVHPDAGVAEQRLLDMIACFAPNMACRMPVTAAGGELPGNIAGALDYQCLAMGKAAFMIELGVGGRQESEHIAAGERGLRRLCSMLGILPAGEGMAVPKLRRVTRRSHVMSNAGGFFRTAVQPAQVLPRGEPLGCIHDVFGKEVEVVRFPQDVIVIAIRRDPVVHSGDRISFVATEWDEVDVRC